MLALVMIGLLQQAPDTLRLDGPEALRRAVAGAPALRAAASRDSASQALVRRAGSWRNPVFSVTAENLGAEVQTTGKSGIAGVEGQMIIEQTFTLGAIGAQRSARRGPAPGRRAPRGPAPMRTSGCRRSVRSRWRSAMPPTHASQPRNRWRCDRSLP